jgi:hypothetical protein
MEQLYCLKTKQTLHPAEEKEADQVKYVAFIRDLEDHLSKVNDTSTAQDLSIPVCSVKILKDASSNFMKAESKI